MEPSGVVVYMSSYGLDHVVFVLYYCQADFKSPTRGI